MTEIRRSIVQTVITLVGMTIGLAWGAVLFGQTPPAPTPGLLLWDYADADIAAGQVTLFSVCLDKLPCVHVAIADAKSATAATYQWKLPALLVGPHSVTVQACNDGSCSEAAPLAFAVTITPAKPSNLRAGGGIARLP